MTTKFGLITEGITDQIIIEDILCGYFGEDNIRVNPLIPDRDKYKFSNWLKVFKYCQSRDFKESFQLNDYVIIQIDTDVSEETHYDIKQDREGQKLTPKELIIEVRQKFVGLISEEFYNKYHEKIIFAISVHSIECWLLPLYYQDRNKFLTSNCLHKLNKQLEKNGNLFIDSEKKQARVYREISIQYLENKTLLKCYPYNPSFKIFIEELQNRNISSNH